MFRPFVVFAGLLGAAGIATAAAASHGGDANLAIAGNFLMIHAAAFLAIAALPRHRMLIGAAAVLAVGVLLFAGDLAVRSRFGNALFPMAAPIGGGGMILGWLGIAAAGLMVRRN